MEVGPQGGTEAEAAQWRQDPLFDQSVLLSRAADWWLALHADGAVNARRAKDSVPAALRPSTLLLDVLDGGNDFRMMLIGERIQRFTHGHVVGSQASTIFGEMSRSRILRDMHRAAVTGVPVIAEPGYVGPDPTIASALHLLLPLTDATGAVAQLLLFVDFIPADRDGLPQPLAPPGRRAALVQPVLAGGLVLAAIMGVGIYLHGLIDRLERDRLDRQVGQIGEVLSAEFGRLEQGIRATAALAADGKLRSADDFRLIAESLFSDGSDSGAIGAVALIVELPAGRPEAFRALRRRLAGGDAPAPAPWPGSEAERRFPALLAWPETAAEGVIGHDIWSDPRHRTALQRSRDQDRPIVSAPAVLSQDGSSGAGPVSALLVERIDKPLQLIDGDGRELRIETAALAVGLDLDEIVRTALGGLADSLNLLVFDAGPTDIDTGPSGGSPRVEILALPPTAGAAEMDGAGRAADLTLAGHRIGLWIAPRSAVTRNLAGIVAGGLLLLGALLALAVGIALYRWRSNLAVLELMVERRTREIAELNRELTQRANQAVVADTAKSRLLATLSHELRTPLNGIIGFTDLLKLRFDSLTTEQQRDYLDTVAESGMHMQRVITRFLELSQDTPSAERLQFEWLPLKEFEAWLQATMTPVAEGFGVTFSVALCATEVVALRADQVALRQAVLNFVDNGLKFTPRGGDVAVGFAPEGDGWRLRVRDTGIGMKPERLAALEEPLTEGGGAPVHGPRGLGLGMTLSRSLLALLGFRLRLQSSPGAGTTIDVLIPADAVRRRAIEP